MNEEQSRLDAEHHLDATPETHIDHNELEEFPDLGFGTHINRRARRLMNHDGSFNIQREHAHLLDQNLFQYLISISWKKFWLLTLLGYLGINLFFTLLYLMVGLDQIANIPADARGIARYAYAFYFSVQTFTTVGYGILSPTGHGAELIAAVEAMSGWLGFAIASGILFGRFSRPSARILYSDKVLVAPYAETGRGLMIRIVNGRNTPLIELEAIMLLSWFEPSKPRRRKFAVLELERSQVSLFPLNWTIVHPIDENSPLKNWNERTLHAYNPELMILVKGYDESFAQTVHSRHSYTREDFTWGAKFEPMYHVSDEGKTVLDLAKLHRCSEAPIAQH